MTSPLKRCYNELKRFRALNISKRLLLNSICTFGGKETLSAFPPPHFPSSSKFQNSVFSYYLQKKVIETAKKCDCDRKRLLKRLGCFKSLKTSQGRLVVKTLKYTFFPQFTKQRQKTQLMRHIICYCPLRSWQLSEAGAIYFKPIYK